MSLQDNPTFNLCGYKLRVQDYQQILCWARNINADPEQIIERLEDSELQVFDGETIKFEIRGTAIVSLVWDFELLPIEHFGWLEELSISTIGLKNSPSTPELAFNLPALQKLYCFENQLSSIDVSEASSLVLIDCADNNIKELNVDNCRNLRTLRCNGNQIESLNLDPLNSLEELNISQNKNLYNLDFIRRPNIKHLSQRRRRRR